MFLFIRIYASCDSNHTHSLFPPIPLHKNQKPKTMKKYLTTSSKSLKLFLLAFGVCFTAASCSSDSKKETEAAPQATATTATAEGSENGIGPVAEVDLGAEIDQALADKGKSIFEAKCSACHKFDSRYVGPALSGVTERRHAAWIMNMILNPQEMTQKDPVAKKLLGEYMTQMVAQDVTREDARALVEYFRQVDNQN